jgi:hypothetical protein
MKSHLTLLLAAVALIVAPYGIRAADGSATPSTTAGDSLTIQGNDKDKDKDKEKGDDNKAGKATKPDRPDNVSDTKGKTDKSAIDTLKDDFKTQAALYQKKQKELLDQLKHADADERDKIRSALKELKDKFSDLRLEFKDKLTDLKPKIDKDVIDDAKKGGKPRK